MKMLVRRLSVAVPIAFVSALVACGGESATSAPASAAGPKPPIPEAPESLRPPPGEVLAVKAVAQGTQNYECRAGDGGTFAWKLVAPEAELADSSGKRIGHHYAGPTWESVDGSKVVGEVKTRVDAPDGQAIQWLLLKAKMTSGSGVFAKVTSVQRLDTVGGLAPSTGCDAQHPGAKQNVGYSATYYFYAAP
jgi:hypothetical protein